MLGEADYKCIARTETYVLAQIIGGKYNGMYTVLKHRRCRSLYYYEPICSYYHYIQPVKNIYRRLIDGSKNL